MPARNTSSKRRRFGTFLGDLRDSLGESQEEFADRLNYSQSIIKNTETGEPPSANLVAKLIEVFPERKDEIEREVELWTKPHTHRARHRRTARLRFDSFLAADQLDEAREYLLRELGAQYANDEDTAFLVWIQENLSMIEHLRDNPKASHRELINATVLAHLF